MRPNDAQLKTLSITPSIFDRMIRWGWCDSAGRSKVWYDFQRPNHDAQFEEPRERKAGPKKFNKNKREEER